MLKVIIADDEKLICRLVQALADWQALGMEVAGTAENGIEALELIRSEKPDILVTDIRMPGCDGLELIKRAKEIQPELEIVIISGYAHFEYAQSAIQYGVGNYLLKPIKKDELMGTLEMLRGRCEKRRSMEESARGHKNSMNDLSRLRESLIKDLIAKEPVRLNRQMMRETYHVHADGGLFQAFLLKIDCDPRQMDQSALEVLQNKIKSLYAKGPEQVCRESLLYFQSYTGYGILNYDKEQRSDVRKSMRSFLNHLEAKKGLYGQVEFSLALGSAAEDPGELGRSMAEARDAVQERFLEGTGKLLEGVFKGAEAEKQNLLDKYVKSAGNAVDILDRAGAGQACDELEEEILSLLPLSGKDILELILSAGRFFISRAGMNDVEERYQKFMQMCSQCSDVRALLAVLRAEQETLLSEIEDVRKNEAARPVRLAKQYVMQHYQEQITLEEVCEAVGFSPSYFSTLFKKETGEGFSKYLTRIRMEEAKILLRETNMPVAQVCERVGYNDRKHFTQTFHKMSGLSPADYRKLYG